ncbi:MAG: hypothetical protein Q9160_006378 [Pyrenula sp. 1 TL-2023]
MQEVCKNPTERFTVDPDEIFRGVAILLSSSMREEEDSKRSFVHNEQSRGLLCLCSDRGWSVFLSTFGMEDPARIRPELIHVRRGTPTKRKTQERKIRIRDGRGIMEGLKDIPQYIQRGKDYVPRTAARVTRRTEYLATNAEEFEPSIMCSIEPSPEWRKFPGVKDLREIVSYRELHEGLWQTHATPSCKHHPPREAAKIKSIVKLGPDAAAVLGYKYLETSSLRSVVDHSETMSAQGSPEKILVVLSLGQADIRWLTILGNHIYQKVGKYRTSMLRTENCCEECALKYVARQPGKWILIL